MAPAVTPGGQLPLDLGRHAGGARVPPVGVPARVHPKLHPREHRVARPRRLRGQDQPRLRVGGLGGKTGQAEPGGAQEIEYPSHENKMPQFGDKLEMISPDCKCARWRNKLLRMLAEPVAADWTWFCSGREIFPAMLAAIDAAQRIGLPGNLHLTRRIPWGSNFVTALVRARQRGARVRVLVDALGSIGLPAAFWKPLRAVGGEVRLVQSARLGPAGNSQPSQAAGLRRAGRLRRRVQHCVRLRRRRGDARLVRFGAEGERATGGATGGHLRADVRAR